TATRHCHPSRRAIDYRHRRWRTRAARAATRRQKIDDRRRLPPRLSRANQRLLRPGIAGQLTAARPSTTDPAAKPPSRAAEAARYHKASNRRFVRRRGMDWLTDRWDVLLSLIAVYVAVMALVRMMARRRDQVVADVERQIETHRKQAKAA